MFSDAVLDHFQNPRNAGELPDADARVEVSNPVCGDILQLAARVEDGRIAEARFLCRGCTTSIACASLLTEQLRGRTLAEARSLTAQSLSRLLGELPAATFHGAELAADAVQSLLRKLSASQR
jgi:nitrogen fixation protein NifU and related proteins